MNNFLRITMDVNIHYKIEVFRPKKVWKHLMTYQGIQNAHCSASTKYSYGFTPCSLQVLNRIWMILTYVVQSSTQKKCQLRWLCERLYKKRTWLFSDSADGAKMSVAMLFLIKTTKENDVKPYAYLQHVIGKIAAANRHG